MDDDRVNLAAADGVQGLLGLSQPSARFGQFALQRSESWLAVFGIHVREVFAKIHHVAPIAVRKELVSERSPIA